MVTRNPYRATKFATALVTSALAAGVFLSMGTASAAAAPAATNSSTTAASTVAASDIAPSQPLATQVTLKNNTQEAVYISRYRGMGIWSNWTVLWAGQSETFRNSYRGSDDVEFRISRDKTRRTSIDVDAENPLYSTPWMSVDWNSEYFNVGGTYTWQVKSGGELFGTRHHDADGAKQFELVINKVW